MVLWFIGMAQSGKTTLSRMVYERLKPSVPNLVLLDGDVMRDVFGGSVGHSVEEREINARRLSALSHFLAGQDIHVIAAVLSIFPDWQKWNRTHIQDYSEVYLNVPLDILKKRDTKNLYARADRGELENVVGIDIPFPEPRHPDLVIDNSEEKTDFSEEIEKILALPSVRHLM